MTTPACRAAAAMTRARKKAAIVKTSGILDPLIYAPLSAIAGAVTGPSGKRGRSAALGAVIGAGVSQMAQKEYEERRARGEDVPPTDFKPLIKSILAGLATGGTMRAVGEQQERGRVGILSSILAGAPAGALLMGDNPVMGSIVGSVAVPMVARLVGRREGSQEGGQVDTRAVTMADVPEVRARAAYLAAAARIQLAREFMRARIDAAILRQLEGKPVIRQAEATRFTPERDVGERSAAGSVTSQLPGPSSAALREVRR